MDVNCIQVGHNYGPHPLTDVCMVPTPVQAHNTDTDDVRAVIFCSCGTHMFVNTRGKIGPHALAVFASNHKVA